MPAARRLPLTGPAIAAAIASAWLTIHIAGIFFFPLHGMWLAWVPVLIVLQTWLSTGLFITAHDCMHGSFAPGRPRLARAVGRVTLMLYAAIDYDRMLPNHFAHHRHVGTAHDPDFDAAHPTAVLPWFRHFFGGYYTHWQLARIVAVLSAYQLCGASLLNILLFWAVPALLALGQLFYFGTFLPHRHDDAGFVDRHNARSNRMPRWLSALISFPFCGYHHEHHLRPQVPWWALPQTRS